MATLIGSRVAYTPGMIDVIILNWDRPRHIQEHLIPLLTSCSQIGRIIISHGKRETYFEAPGPRVVCLDHSGINATFGLALRFHSVSHAETDAVLILDDDQILQSAHIAQLASAYDERPGHIHGYDARYAWKTRSGLVYGRRTTRIRHCADPVFLKQMIWDPPGPCMVLTKTLIAPRTALEAFNEHAHQVEPFIRAQSRPLWNGEDMFFSLLHLSRTGRLPVIHKPVVRRGETPEGDTGISSDKAYHFSYRTAFLRHACEVLDLKL